MNRDEVILLGVLAMCLSILIFNAWKTRNEYSWDVAIVAMLVIDLPVGGLLFWMLSFISPWVSFGWGILSPFIIYLAIDLAGFLWTEKEPQQPVADAEPAREQLSETISAPVEKVSQTENEQIVCYSDVRSSFDAAVSRKEERSAITYGRWLVKAGENQRAMTGFKKLARSGYKESTKEYLQLVYKNAYEWRRRLARYADVWKKRVDELEEAREIALANLDEKDDAIHLCRCEQMCWYAIAKDMARDDSADTYRKNADSIRSELVSAGYDDFPTKESIEFVLSRGISAQRKDVKQTLMHCLRCKHSVFTRICKACGFDHGADSVSLLGKVDAEKLQIGHQKVSQ